MKQLPYAKSILVKLKSGERLAQPDKLYVVIGPHGWEEEKFLQKNNNASIRVFPDMDPADYDWGLASWFEMVIMIAPDLTKTEIPAAYCLHAGARLVLARNYDATEFVSYWPERRP